MTDYEKQTAIESLVMALTEKIEYYNECLRNDETLEVRKQLRIQIKEIQKQIAELRESVNGQLR